MSNLIAKLRYMARQYTSGRFARGGTPQKHYLDEAADEIVQLRTENESLKQQVEQGKRDAVLDIVITHAAFDVLSERWRQESSEGWTNDHDDQHDAGEIAVAAGCYALSGSGKWSKEALWNIWPNWSLVWFKPKTQRSDLVRAGALILAEIERIDRAIAAAPKQEK